MGGMYAFIRECNEYFNCGGKTASDYDNWQLETNLNRPHDHAKQKCNSSACLISKRMSVLSCPGFLARLVVFFMPCEILHWKWSVSAATCLR